MVSVPARREQVAYAMRRGLSQRRSCTLLGVSRSALGYCSVKTTKDEPVLVRMAELGRRYPRSGYRSIRIYLDREGHRMSWGRCYRLWRLAKLQVPRRRPRKRIATGRPRPQAPTCANQVWTYDFVFDWCANGELILGRVWPARKGRSITLDLPPLEKPADIVAALGVVTGAVGDGSITPEEGQAVATLLEAKRKAIETMELEARVCALENEKGRR
jgi:putative transposase